MKNWSYLEASTKVLKDLDLYEESFVEPDELVGYFNEAVEDAEAEIHRLSLEEDYFLAKYLVPLAQGQNTYDLPPDIYNRDIRRVMYSNGSSQIYPVRRFRGANKFEAIAFAQTLENSAPSWYRYFLEMDAAKSQDQMILVPASTETSSTVMTMWYIRCARRIPLIADGSLDATNATVIDIPTFINFIFAYVKVKIKEKGGEQLDSFMLDLQQKRQKMIDTLSGFKDDDDEIVPDLRHYLESN